jgi:hypothetical protein
MHKIPPTPAALPRWFWPAVIASTVMGAVLALLIARLLGGSTAHAISGTLMAVPAGAIQIITLLKRRHTPFTEAELKRGRKMTRIIIPVSALLIGYLVLTDIQPTGAIGERTSLMLGVMLPLLGLATVLWPITQRLQQLRAAPDLQPKQ